MKKLVVILFIFLGSTLAFGKCGAGGLQFYPEQKEISLNTMFIIQGYAKSQENIIEFYKKRVYLISENGELIELKLQKMYKGQKDLTQAIFKPEKELKPNTKYFLKNPNDSIEFYSQWSSEKKENENVYWITTNLKESKAINPNLNIEFNKTEIIQYGCGPSVNAIFNVKNNSGGEIWYKTEVINLSNNRTNTYYIKDLDGKLNVGHGMCAGAFAFDRSSKYKVRFTPMNIDGKEIDVTNWIEFENPFLKEK